MIGVVRHIVGGAACVHERNNNLRDVHVSHTELRIVSDCLSMSLKGYVLMRCFKHQSYRMSIIASTLHWQNGTAARHWSLVIHLAPSSVLQKVSPS